MKITLINVGKNSESYINEGIDKYNRRINNYVSFKIQYLTDVKVPAGKHNPLLQNELEGRKLIRAMDKADHVILLDEKGMTTTSKGFAGLLRQHLNRSVKHLLFVTGGAYGFSDEVRHKADASLSLSVMTFPHQLVRLIFTEQLYRALTILRGEPYHHE